MSYFPLILPGGPGLQFILINECVCALNDKIDIGAQFWVPIKTLLVRHLRIYVSLTASVCLFVFFFLAYSASAHHYRILLLRIQ